MTNYVQRIKDALREFHPNMKDELVEFYTLLVLVKGEDVTLEDVHDAWSVWKNQHRQDHWSLIPFDELSAEKQAMDEPFVKSIRTVAAIIRVIRERS